MLDTLSPTDRLRLMKFVCAVAWSDLRIAGEERLFVADCLRKLQFAPDEKAQIWQWLEVPPAPDELDPAEVPPAHRQAFITAIGKLVAADQTITHEERESLLLLSQLLR